MSVKVCCRSEMEISPCERAVPPVDLVKTRAGGPGNGGRVPGVVHGCVGFHWLFTAGPRGSARSQSMVGCRGAREGLALDSPRPPAQRTLVETPLFRNLLDKCVSKPSTMVPRGILMIASLALLPSAALAQVEWDLRRPPWSAPPTVKLSSRWRLVPGSTNPSECLNTSRSSAALSFRSSRPAFATDAGAHGRC